MHFVFIGDFLNLSSTFLSLSSKLIPRYFTYLDWRMGLILSLTRGLISLTDISTHWFSSFWVSRVCYELSYVEKVGNIYIVYIFSALIPPCSSWYWKFRKAPLELFHLVPHTIIFYRRKNLLPLLLGRCSPKWVLGFPNFSFDLCSAEHPRSLILQADRQISWLFGLCGPSRSCSRLVSCFL